MLKPTKSYTSPESMTKMMRLDKSLDLSRLDFIDELDKQGSFEDLDRIDKTWVPDTDPQSVAILFAENNRHKEWKLRYPNWDFSSSILDFGERIFSKICITHSNCIVNQNKLETE